MSSYVDAIKTRLASDADLIARLAQWEFVTGTPSPSIHTTAPAPDDAFNPLMTIEADVATASGVRDRADSNLSFTINLWGDKGESDRELNALAHIAFRRLTGQTLTTVEGDSLYILNVTAPQKLTDLDGFPGFVIIVQGRISESLIN